MTRERLSVEMLYHTSLSPFKKLSEDGLISNEDLMTIDGILRAKYSPVFVENTMEYDWIYSETRGNMTPTKGGEL